MRQIFAISDHSNDNDLNFQDENMEHPIDIMLFDWQGVTRGSPVHDIGGLFLSVTSKETLNDLKHYLSLYHEKLSKCIRELGSDPDLLYPYEIFEKEWIRFGLYSFGIAIESVKTMLVEKDNAPVLKEPVDQNLTQLSSVVEQAWGKVPDHEEQYLNRLKSIARHLIQIGAL